MIFLNQSRCKNKDLINKLFGPNWSEYAPSAWKHIASSFP